MAKEDFQVDSNPEWLHLFVAHPGALASLQAWLKTREYACAEYALDGPESDVPKLKGKRDAFREIQAYIHNNITLVQHGLNAVHNDAGLANVLERKRQARTHDDMPLSPLRG